MAKEWVDFKEIKAKVTMEMVLSHYGLLDRLKQSVKGFRGPCPIHEGSHANQFHVDPVKNRWNCFGGCNMEKLEGHVIGFVAAKEKVSLREAALMIASWYGLSKDHPHRSEREETKVEPQKEPVRIERPPDEQTEDPENKELTFVLKSLSVEHPFFSVRNIEPKTIQAFGLGLCSKGIMKDRVVFPLHRHDGALIGYTGRTVREITEENPKWLLPPGLIKPKVLFNAHRVLGKFKTVIVVEGPLDLVAVHQAGFPNVVALLGKELLTDGHLSYDQLRLIVNHFESAVLLLDGDKDGRERGKECVQKLAGQIFVRLITLPDDKDPSDCTLPELSKVLSFPK